jgi:GGDEF domain-containing protein
MGEIVQRVRLKDYGIESRGSEDEFAILLPQIGAEEALVVADEFVKALGRQTAVLASQSIRNRKSGAGQDFCRPAAQTRLLASLG